MRFTNKTLFNSLLAGCLVFGLSSCEENSLIFPEQIEVESPAGSDRGPVKQGDLDIITDFDEKVKFDLSSVDTERIASLRFSHNGEGVEAETEVTDFNALYVISNLPLDKNSGITVWAVGQDGKVSKPYVYDVKPFPYPAVIVSNTLEVLPEVRSGIARLSNTTNLGVVFHYKVDDAATYTAVDIPVASLNLEIELPRVAIGEHTITYYFTDPSGGRSAETTATFEALPPPVITFTAEQKEGWTPYSNHPYGAGYGANLAIDGTNAVNYTGATEVHTYYVHFTNTRMTNADNVWNSADLITPAGPFTPITIKSVSPTFVAWGTNPMIFRLYGIDEDRNETLLKDITVEHFDAGTIDISAEENTQSFIGFKLEMSRPTGQTQFALEEINLRGFTDE